jgi:hypothetical protein
MGEIVDNLNKSDLVNERMGIRWAFLANRI